MKASVSNLAECLQAFTHASAARTDLMLILPEEAVHSLGLLYLQQMITSAHAAYPHISYQVTCHCGDDAALAQAALRLGFMRIGYRGDAATVVKLANIARQYGAILL